MNIELYLVRHGEAKADNEDSTRPLSDQGRNEIKLVVKRVSKIGVSNVAIMHSSKLRAKQTAEIFAKYLHPISPPCAIAGMEPNDDPGLIMPEIENAIFTEKNLLLVGHLPYIPRLISLLLPENSSLELIQIQTGTIVCLKHVNGAWQLAWVLTPESLKQRIPGQKKIGKIT